VTVQIGICTRIDSRQDETRILATTGPKQTILKARLSSTVAHGRAVPALLEALALWQGLPVRAACVVDEGESSSASRLALDPWARFGNDGIGDPLYGIDFVHRHKRPHRDPIDGMGAFNDLRQLLMFEVAR